MPFRLFYYFEAVLQVDAIIVLFCSFLKFAILSCFTLPLIPTSLLLNKNSYSYVPVQRPYQLEILVMGFTVYVCC